ncbi:MAG: MBL fold metallo-hydrolase [Spongiibacteraceae bacterium]|jgi:glyoxylase-like metal-dependent hydrolase (beta-lactamase superfamily II)|nr:MBL fold metallo-hydrolase [Spongiibacteraceae bacterium]
MTACDRWLDAAGSLAAGIEIGTPVTLSQRVRRLTAPNASYMTGPGTNTYLIGHERVAVLDPGTADSRHLETILAVTGGRIGWIIVTHTHPDHSPGAAELAQATGAPVLGNRSLRGVHQDPTFAPAGGFSHGQKLATEEFTLQALLTPGHADNHVCFLLEEEGMLFSGDHIMQGSSVVIFPPSGDMRAYLASLQMLKDYPLQSIAPGHGTVIREPFAEIDKLVKHRLQRERRLLEQLARRQPASVQTLARKVYTQLDPRLTRMAEATLLAHLLKLQEEGVAVESDGEWSLAAGDD